MSKRVNTDLHRDDFCSLIYDLISDNYIANQIIDFYDELPEEEPEKAIKIKIDKDTRLGARIVKSGSDVYKCPECESFISRNSNFCNECGCPISFEKEHQDECS